MKKVLLERKGEWVVSEESLGTVLYRAEYRNFAHLCTIAEYELGRSLSELESVNIQAMLGSNSISKLTIGPGAKMHYELADGSCHQ